MNCAYHAEAQNVGFCIRCGRALCNECIRNVRGSVYCENCLADVVQGTAAVKEADGGTNPGAAFALGLIPGVGAIYNGEFVKAAVHILIFGLLVQFIALDYVPLFPMLAFGFYWYMPFEAYYTAKKRNLKKQGIDLETPFDRMHQQIGGVENKDLWGGVALVVLGSLFLLQNFNIFRIDWIARLWPVILIVIGLWLLKRFRGRAAE